MTDLLSQQEEELIKKDNIQLRMMEEVELRLPID